MAILNLKKSIKGLTFLTKRLPFFGTKQENGDQFFFDERGAGIIREMELVKRNGERVKVRSVVPAGENSMVISRPSTAGSISAAQAMGMYRNWAYAAIKPIAEEIGCIEWRALKVGSNEEMEEHDLLDFLEAVNDHQTGVEWRQILVSHLELAGNAYILLLDKNGKPVDSYNAKPASM